MCSHENTLIQLQIGHFILAKLLGFSMKYNVTKNDTDTDINIDINIDIDARIFNDIGTNYSDVIFIVGQILH